MSTEDKTPIPPLGGEAIDGIWHFQNRHRDGPLPNPTGFAFPLLTHDFKGRWELVGSGFYVSSNGLFVTAKHVVQEVLDGNLQVRPLVILHSYSSIGLFGPQEALFRPIGECWLADGADVAMGAAAISTNNVTGEVLSHWYLRLEWAIPSVGDHVVSCGFPNYRQYKNVNEIYFQPEIYDGVVRKVDDYRDSLNMPFPYVETTCRLHGAASGGPIGNSQGRVVAVNCSELAGGLENPPGPSYGTAIRCLAGAYFENTFGDVVRGAFRISLSELVGQGVVEIDNYTSADTVRFPGRLVRLDRLLPSAPEPQIGFFLPT